MQVLFQNVEKAIEDLNFQDEISKVVAIEKIINVGVMLTPAFVVDREV
jgi:hypothetical protein